MTTSVPSGYATISPYLVVHDALGLLAFLERAVVATEVRRAALPDGAVFNVEASVGTSVIILVQARPGQEVTATAFYVYGSDVDVAHERALAAGGVSTMEPPDQFYGDRGAGFRDPAGNDWWLATRVEDLSSDELAKRIADPSFRRH